MSCRLVSFDTDCLKEHSCSHCPLYNIYLFSLLFSYELVLSLTRSDRMNQPSAQLTPLLYRGNPSYVRFINMLINDTTFLLDESIDALRSIRDVQKLMADEVTWNATSQVSHCSRGRAEAKIPTGWWRWSLSRIWTKFWVTFSIAVSLFYKLLPFPGEQGHQNTAARDG